MEDIDYARQVALQITGDQSNNNASIKECINVICEHFDHILSKLPGSVYWKGSDGAYLGGNDNLAYLVGLSSRSELYGKTDEFFAKSLGWNEQVVNSFREDNKKVMNGCSIINREEPMFRDANNKMIHQLTTRVPLINKKGNIVGVLGTSIDITDLVKTKLSLKKEKEKAEVASYAKSRFLATVSHELRTPLNGMLGMAQVLLNSRLTKGQREQAKIIFRTGNDLLYLINNILDFAKLEEEQTGVSSEVFHLQDVCNRLMMLLQHDLSATVKMTVKVDESLAKSYFSDARKIQQILINLLSNAMKFTSAGEISLTVNLHRREKSYDMVCFRVADTGSGIAECEQEKIFDRFYKIETPQHVNQEGTGIGLAVVKSLVDILNGKVKVSSKLGKGTCFDVIIPLQHDSQLCDDTPIQVGETEASQYCGKILLVEDNRINQMVVSEMLRNTRIDIDSVDTFAQAMVFIQENSYDLILLDINLPDGNSLELLSAINVAERSSMPPIIAVSAGVAESDMKVAEKIGIKGYIVKPIKMQELLKVLAPLKQS